MTNRVIIFDTTLRDGEQAPGFSMTEAAKLRVARALAKLKVDVIEAGFAAASPGDARAIAAIAREIEGPVICSLARTTRGDIDEAWRALKHAPRRRLHLFIGTSPIHRDAKLHMSRAEVLTAIRDSIAYARDRFDDIEFSAEDAIRTEREYLVEALQAATDAGATTLNVPDTVGYTTPEEIQALFADLDRWINRGAHVLLSAHCHDDLGMAVANSLAAVRGGARQIECAINGIGERAGNCALEEVAMALKTRADLFQCEIGVDTTQLAMVSRTLAQVTNVSPPRNKAIVGANAFAHEAGIHQHGMLQDRNTYEIMKPEDIGLAVEGIVLGKHSGRHALVARARALGHVLEGERLDQAFAAFKALADEIGTIDSGQLVALLDTLGQNARQKPWKLSRIDIRSPVSASAMPIARVELDHGDRGRVCDLASAPGELDAVFAAVGQIMGVSARVDGLELHYLAAERLPGDMAQSASVLVEIILAIDGQLYQGRARGLDIIPCCVAAYIDAANNAAAVKSVPVAAPSAQAA